MLLQYLLAQPVALKLCLCCAEGCLRGSDAQAMGNLGISGQLMQFTYRITHTALLKHLRCMSTVVYVNLLITLSCCMEGAVEIC